MSVRDLVAVSSASCVVVGLGMMFFPLSLISLGVLLGWICYQMPSKSDQEDL